jgi:6-phosphogluconolactonase (cycloisomerase 2 family)
VAPASGATIFATAVSTTSGETTTTTITPCTTQQFAATAYYSDGSQKDISSVAGWSSSNTNAATIDTSGLASAASAVTAAGGTSIITATAGGASATANLAVDILTSITVAPAAGTVPLGGTQQYTATGTLTVAGGSTTTMDLTTQVAWSVTGGTTSADGSTNSNSVASIGTATGTLTATGAVDSTTTVTASICTASGSTTVTVAAPAAQTLLISPRVQSIVVGQTIDFTSVVVNTDGSTSPVTLPLVWTSGTPAVASIISQTAGDGLATGLTAGETVITATMGTGDTAITGTTTLTVSAAVARFAYVLNFADGSASGYAPQAATGAFTPLGKSSSSANQLVPHPSGMFVYSLNVGNTISVLTVDPVSGALSASAAPTTPAVGTGTEFAALDPSGRWLYVVDGTSNMVFAFSIDQSTGALTAIGTGTATGSSPLQVLVAPNDQFVYVINSSAAGSVSVYSINTTTTPGALTALTGPTTVLNAPAFSAIDPASAYLFVPTSGDNTIVPFTIGTDGTLTAGTPFTFTPALTTSDFLKAVAVDPTSKFLYVVDAGTSSETTTTGNLYALSIGAGGALTQTINGGSPYALGNLPNSVVLDPTGTILMVANNADNTVSVFTAAADGSLTPDNLVEAAGAPAFPVFINGAAEATSSVSAVVAANIANSTLSAFTADSTGALTVVGTPLAGLAGNSKVTDIPFGTSIFTTSHTAKDLGGYNVDTTSTTPFSQIAAPVVLPGAAGSAIVDLSGSYAYVADTDNNTVTSVPVSSSTIGPVGSSVTVAGGVLSMASDPQTTLLYALGTNTITAIRAHSTGAISLGPALTVTGTWTAGAVSPDGRYLVAVDFGTKTLTVFAITAVGGTGSPADGTLTAVTGSTAVAIPGANTVSSVVFDPLNRGFAVTDSGANSVTPFSIDSTGAVVAKTAVTTPTGATSAAVDPTGSFLFVGIYGDPTATPPVPGSVQAYSISSSSGSPALTAVGSPVNADLGTWGVGVLSTVQ